KCMDQRVAVPIARIGGRQRQHGADRLLVAFDHARRAIWIGYIPTSVFRRPCRDPQPWNGDRGRKGGRTSENLTTRNRYVLQHLSVPVDGQQGAKYRRRQDTTIGCMAFLAKAISIANLRGATEHRVRSFGGGGLPPSDGPR